MDSALITRRRFIKSAMAIGALSICPIDYSPLESIRTTKVIYINHRNEARRLLGELFQRKLDDIYLKHLIGEDT